MSLPFTTEQFFSLFAQYNRAVWPIQIILNLLALAAVFLAVTKAPQSDRIIAGILAFFWFWIGIAYHLAFFVTINPAAYVFAGLNILQGVCFLIFGVLQQRLSFQYQANIYGYIGAALILYAIVIYPILGFAFGHLYPAAPTFGLPCPTTIFTFGMLLWTDARVPKTVLVIPFIWSIIGFSAAFTLGVPEDTGLLVAGIFGVTMITLRDRHASAPHVRVGHAA